ncbi:MAG: hypothetical protein K6T66_10840 [Peptococcaceae bacterium]|nr:hypothetical protein [Peptococcaceae bacterium]
MAREEKDLHNLGRDLPPEEEAENAEAGTEGDEDAENHLGYHNFYGY